MAPPDTYARVLDCPDASWIAPEPKLGSYPSLVHVADHELVSLCQSLPLLMEVEGDEIHIVALLHDELAKFSAFSAETGLLRPIHVPFELKTFPFRLDPSSGDLTVLASCLSDEADRGQRLCTETGDLTPKVENIKAQLLRHQNAKRALRTAARLLFVSGAASPIALKSASSGEKHYYRLNGKHFFGLNASKYLLFSDGQLSHLDLAISLIFSDRHLGTKDYTPLSPTDDLNEHPLTIEVIDSLVRDIRPLEFGLDESDLVNLNDLIGDNFYEN